MATRTAVNRDIRTFAFVWTGVTIIVGVATFFAIYLTYDSGESIFSQSIALPQNATDPPAAVAAAGDATNTATAVPTLAASATPEPTEEPMMAEPAETDEPAAVAQAEENVSESQSLDESEMQQEEEEPQPTATFTPTPLPVDVDEYEVGIQVQFSISYDENIQNLWMNDVEELGLNWFKMQARWEDLEPEEGEYDWSKLDLALPIAAERNLKVALSVLAPPEWAREPGADLNAEGPPADNGDFTRFLGDMLERYPGMIHAVEIWNEPNIDREWSSPSGLSAPDLIELIRVSNQTIKNIDPGIIVISGALSPTGGFVDPATGEVRAIDDFDFLDQMIAAGLLDTVDCIGVHHNGYNVGPSLTWDEIPNDPSATFRGPFDNPHHSWSFRSTLQTYANKVAVAGGEQKLCITEFGWPSVEDMDGFPEGFGFARDNTLEEQAEWTVEALDNMEEWGIVRLAFIWNLNYGPQAGWDATNDNTPYSLIGPEWARRPAYDAVKQWSAERINE